MTPYYDDGACQIFHGDCRELMPRLQAVDLLCTDPPYGIGADRGQANRANKQHGRALAASRDYGVTDWDREPPQPWVIECARGLARWQVIFGGNYFLLPLTRCWLIWDKDNGSAGR